jgi:hypothetical protein
MSLLSLSPGGRVIAGTSLGLRRGWRSMARTAAFSLGCVLFAGCYGLGPAVRPPPTESRESGREFLVARQPEEPGYGLYSYLLFGSPPTPATRARYVATAAACLEDIQQVTEMEDYLPRSTLNVTYLMVTDPLPPQVAGVRPGSAELRSAAEWVVNHYNYARARAVLAGVPGEHRDGPYLVSHREPLTGGGPRPGDYLVQDLSTAHPELAHSWVQTFLREASDAEYAHRDMLRRLMVRVANAIRVIGDESPLIRVRVAVAERIGG